MCARACVITHRPILPLPPQSYDCASFVIRLFDFLYSLGVSFNHTLPVPKYARPLQPRSVFCDVLFMYDFMTLFAENTTEVEYDAERDSIVQFYQTFTPPPVGKLQVRHARTHTHVHILTHTCTYTFNSLLLLVFFVGVAAVAVMLAQLAEAIAKAIVEDMAILHKWYIYYNSKYAALPVAHPPPPSPTRPLFLPRTSTSVCSG